MSLESRNLGRKNPLSIRTTVTYSQLTQEQLNDSTYIKTRQFLAFPQQDFCPFTQLISQFLLSSWRFRRLLYYCWVMTMLARQPSYRKFHRSLHPSLYPSHMVKYEDVANPARRRRISQGPGNLTGTRPITRLRDIDQPFLFEISFGRRRYELVFYDTSSPESWRLLNPDLIILCYDISQRSSLTNLQQFVRGPFQIDPSSFFYSMGGYFVLTQPCSGSGKSERSSRLRVYCHSPS